MALRYLTAAALCAALPCALAADETSAVERFPARLLASPTSCAQPQWPAEARRYEIEGVTALTFEIGQDGAVRRPEIVRRSGWNMLDHAAIRSLSGCAFQPGLGRAVRGKRYGIQYAWKFSGPPAAHPLLVEGSCRPSPIFAGFRNLDSTPGADGILVRMLIGADGKAARMAAEAGGQPQALLEQALDYLKTCRYAISPGTPGEATDTLYGRLLLKPAR